MEQEYKICLAGTSEIVGGTENIKTMESIQNWLATNQVYYEDNDPAKPVGDSSKFVVLPIEMI